MTTALLTGIAILISFTFYGAKCLTDLEQQRQLALQTQPPPVPTPTPPAPPLPPVPTPEQQNLARQEHVQLANSSLKSKLKDIDTYFNIKRLMETSAARDQRRTRDQQDQYLDYLQRIQSQYTYPPMMGIAYQPGEMGYPPPINAPPILRVAAQPARRIWTPGPGPGGFYDPLGNGREGGDNGFAPAPAPAMVQQPGYGQQRGYAPANPTPQQQPGNYRGFGYPPTPERQYRGGYAESQYAPPAPQQQGYLRHFGYPIPQVAQQRQGGYGGHGYAPAVPPPPVPPQYQGDYGYGPVPPMQPPTHGPVGIWLNEVPVGRPPSADGSVSSRRSSLLSDDGEVGNGGGEEGTITLNGSHYSI